MALEIGVVARLKQPIISGEILDTRYNKDERCLEHLIEYSMDGESHSRWFSEKVLEEVEEVSDEG